jgi:ankyrin repeat protein
MWAARNSHTAIVHALILAGADLNPQNQVSGD